MRGRLLVERGMEVMRSLLPPGKIQLHREHKWHWRRKCKWGEVEAPNTTSMVFHGPEDEHRSQLHVLRFLWQVYLRENPGLVAWMNERKGARVGSGLSLRDRAELS